MSSSDLSPPERIYHYQEEVEALEGYSKGGYHPVCLDDDYAGGRYKVVHKLGFGSFSTIWLARDNIRNKYVAIKIATSENAELSRESAILEHLNQAKSDPTPKEQLYIPSLLDQFFIEGPNGRHQCLVSEPLRCSLSLSKYESPTALYPLEAARAIAAQTILGVKYLHSRGVAHGDLHLGNIMFRMPPMNMLTVNDLYEKYGKPYTEALKRLDGKPITQEAPPYAVMPVWLGVDCADVELNEASIQITDFGEAFQPDQTTRTVSHCPVLIRPPESKFPNQPLGLAADIWMLGCTLYEILGERTLFEGYMPDADHVLAENISAIGKMPTAWWEAWEKRGDFFTAQGDWRQDMVRAHEPRSRSIADRVDSMGRDGEGGFETQERSDLIEMLKQILVFEPAHRITAEELAQCSWMRNWGLPALQKIEES